MGIKSFGSKLLNWFAPPPDTSEDGRDQWPSRASFVLACMGGCAGMGNLLRYPSVLYNNAGLQWFIPYLLSVFLVAIPVLVLEIAIGQAFRGGSVVAYNNMSKRLRGTGLGPLFIGFVVNLYFDVNLAWVMVYFRNSFKSPLPWEGRAQEFYDTQVIANVAPVMGSLTPDGGAVETYTSYPGIGMIGETVGWTAFTWFLVWLCIFRGVGLTGRVIYFTMGLPIAMTIVLVGRGVSLEGASNGLRLVWATFRGSELASGRLWQSAAGQVFFSTGVGFGYFSSYASYNTKHSNAVMDSFLIVGSNVLFENTAALAVFGIVGFLGLRPGTTPLGSFDVGFITLPQATVEMPGAQFWAAAVFFTLMVLGFSSSFAMLDAVVTMWMDSGTKWPRPLVVTFLVILSFLLSLPFCTEFGYYLLNGVDRWINNVALVFVVWAECVAATSVYRWKDVVSQVGLPSYAIYNFGYFGAMIVGNAIAHTVSAAAGAGAGFGFFLVCLIAAVVLARSPDTPAARFWNKNVGLRKVFYIVFYQGNQLRTDLNMVIGLGKNWTIPVFWPVLLRYVAAPLLSIIYAFAYPGFIASRYDPLEIFGFMLGQFSLFIVAGSFIVPRWYQGIIPPQRRKDGDFESVPGVSPSFIEDKAAEVAEEGAGGLSGTKKGILVGEDHEKESRKSTSDEDVARPIR
ncbi:Hypothetical protein D9617_15g041770 [Elsinoe fawcettii]|nr:Hypothetical protein D9617_15g041770 [Elsinoe fawcettii]